MKNFIRRLVLLGIILLIISATIEIALLYLTNTYSYKHNYILTHRNEIKVLLLGNSHIEKGLIPDTLGKGVFNAAISARPVFYDVELLRNYTSILTNLEIVIMPLNYFNFYFGREKLNPKNPQPQKDLDRTFKCMYYKYMDVNADFWYWPELINSKFDYISRFWQKPEESRECDSLGYVALKQTGRLPNWQNKSLPFLVDTSMPKNHADYKKLYNYYLEISKITGDSNVRLILLGVPLYKTYLEDMNSEVVREMKSFVSNLQKAYPHVEYYDFSNDTTYLPEDFYNSNHLTESGASKLSLSVKAVLKKRIEP